MNETDEIGIQTLKLGKIYLGVLKNNRDGFISFLRNSDSICSAAKLFYDYVVGQKIIPAIEEVPVNEKNFYWLIFKDAEMKQAKKVEACKGLYALEKMLPKLDDLI